ncbi:MAG: flavin reductase, partial [Deltaproteobacteria bacterium]|nr:flavin reductase [Deltaproteobacteria bacterium]
PGLNRKKILFVGTENACQSQMAAAFTQIHAGDRGESLSAGTRPAAEVDPLMVTVMAEKGVDMAFRRPVSITDIPASGKPDRVVSMGCEDAGSLFPGQPMEQWDLEDRPGKDTSSTRKIRDEVEQRVVNLLGTMFE